MAANTNKGGSSGVVSGTLPGSKAEREGGRTDRGSIQQQSRDLIFSTDDGLRGPSPEHRAYEQDILAHGTQEDKSRWMQAASQAGPAVAKDGTREQFDERAQAMMLANQRLMME